MNAQGYSSLAVALALPESGRLVACDRSEKALAVAEKYFKRAGVAHKVRRFPAWFWHRQQLFTTLCITVLRHNLSVYPSDVLHACR